MKIRDVYLVNGQSLNDSDTVTVDLTRGLKILKIRVKYKATNGATSNTVGRLNGMVSKLQVVDGSTVLHSLSMREEQAKNFRDYGKMPYQQMSQAGGAYVIEEAVIDFRRFEGDTAFYLDTSGYSNPQLQLTHALTISATAGFATGTGTLSVIATVIDSGAPARQGFILAKELDSFSSTASGDHTTDLPLDFPISSVMVLSPVNSNEPDTYISNFKLTADTDAFIPVDESGFDLLLANRERYGMFRQQQDLLNGTAYTAYFDSYFQTSGHIAQAGATAKAIATVVTLNEFQGVGTTGESGTVTAVMTGSAPHGALIYDFGDGQSSEQIFSPQGVGKLQLKLTNASTGATPKVVVIQQRS